jgi:murein DD-endopeptidase MepM/ murein hydrolase activator NlpD
MNVHGLSNLRVPPDWRRLARTFGVGAIVGFLSGASIVSVIVWRHGVAAAAPAGDHRSPTTLLDDPGAAVLERSRDEPTPMMGRTVASGTDAPARSLSEAAAELAGRDLAMPVDGVVPEALTRQFDDARGSTRRHEAIDILAPRNTPVRAVEDGIIARLFNSRAGGLTIYQFDPTERYAYYYAHLERYAPGLREGDRVTKGQTLGYVGTSGNAPKDTPHLHFAVFLLTADKRWWEGQPVDPYDILR